MDTNELVSEKEKEVTSLVDATYCSIKGVYLDGAIVTQMFITYKKKANGARDAITFKRYVNSDTITRVVEDIMPRGDNDISHKIVFYDKSIKAIRRNNEKAMYEEIECIRFSSVKFLFDNEESYLLFCMMKLRHTYSADVKIQVERQLKLI